MLIPQISTDSVFSRVEGETIEACDHENNFDDESAAQSVPIGIRSFGRRCNISEEYQLGFNKFKTFIQNYLKSAFIAFY